MCEYRPESKAVADKMPVRKVLELYALMANKAKREQDEIDKIKRGR